MSNRLPYPATAKRCRQEAAKHERLAADLYRRADEFDAMWAEHVAKRDGITSTTKKGTTAR